MLEAAASVCGDCIDLDDFIPDGADADVGWVDHVVAGGGGESVREILVGGRVAVVGGAAAWPALSGIVEELRARTSRIYIKRVYVAGDHAWWDDGEGLREHANASPLYFKQIYLHHAEDTPWQLADLVIERVRRSDEH